MMNIMDLHCDLLCYLNNDRQRTPNDSAVRCAIPQLKAGHVCSQVLAVFVETEPGSSLKGWQQAAIFRVLPKRFPESFVHVHSKEECSPNHKDPRISILLAIENASALCDEEESLDLTFQRIAYIEEFMAKIVYISLTWNTENRFGGGASEQNVGLKADGRKLLEFLNGRNIAIDFSHASDRLVMDIIEYIDTNKMTIPLLASHSNSRAILDHPRNLPDEFLQEIIHREGLIGLNFIRPFIGLDSSKNIIRHMGRVLELGGKNALCLLIFFTSEMSL